MKNFEGAWFSCWVGGDRFRAAPVGDMLELNIRALREGRREEALVVVGVAESMEAALLRNLEFKREIKNAHLENGKQRIDETVRGE